MSRKKVFFWTLEVIFLSIPVICFIVFVRHVQEKHFAVKKNDELVT